MRSPLMVPLVLLTLLTLMLLVTRIDSAKSTKFIKKSGKPREKEVTMEKEQKVNRVEVKDEKVLAAIETNLLSLFGFSKRPRPIRDIVIPEAMKELYRRQTGMDVETTNLPLPGRHTASANTVRTFTHQESLVDEQFRQHHRFRLSFPVVTIPKSEKLQAAELQLSGSGARHILVHDIVRPGVRGRSEPILRLIESRNVRPSDGRITLDVMPAVQRWIATPSQNHGLLVVVQDGNGETDRPHVRLKRDVSVRDWQKVQPLLYTYTDDGKQKKSGNLANRPRRGLAKKRRKDGRDNCRRHELYVDFVDVGWNDWIVAPAGYDAYYCGGDCPFPLSDHFNSTNHAIVQTLVNSVFPSSAPKACCVPTSLSSISMLYVDEESKVVLKNYQDMSIVGCGCR